MLAYVCIHCQKDYLKQYEPGIRERRESHGICKKCYRSIYCQKCKSGRKKYIDGTGRKQGYCKPCAIGVEERRRDRLRRKRKKIKHKPKTKTPKITHCIDCQKPLTEHDILCKAEVCDKCWKTWVNENRKKINENHFSSSKPSLADVINIERIMEEYHGPRKRASSQTVREDGL